MNKLIDIMQKEIAFVALFIFCTLGALGQGTTTLHIGDDMPEVKYSKWIKGTPIKSFKNDHVYVLEFWATWCGPCIAAMPHLSEQAKKYEGKVSFIGVDVFETTGDEPYESFLPKVEKFVESSGDRMSYHVIMDNNAQDMSTKWLKAAGIAGIPSTFVISKGKVVWIGHPIKLDEVIDPIIAGTFDVAAFKAKYEKESAASIKLVNDLQMASKGIDSALAKKDFDLAFKLMDKGEIDVPQMKLAFIARRFKTLLDNFPEKRAMDYAKELNKESKTFLYMTAFNIIEKDGLSKDSYQYAADILKATPSPPSSILNRIAAAERKSGLIQQAVSVQQQAVDLVKTELGKKEFEGTVFDYTVKEYQEKLDEYKRDLAKK